MHLDQDLSYIEAWLVPSLATLTRLARFTLKVFSPGLMIKV